jgi:hypothetical protein
VPEEAVQITRQLDQQAKLLEERHVAWPTRAPGGRSGTIVNVALPTIRGDLAD